MVGKTVASPSRLSEALVDTTHKAELGGRTKTMKREIKRIEVIEIPEQFYFKVSAGAKYLGICPNTLRKFTDIGDVNAKILPSGDRLYCKEWLDEFVQKLPDAVKQETVD